MPLRETRGVTLAVILAIGRQLAIGERACSVGSEDAQTSGHGVEPISPFLRSVLERHCGTV